MLIMHCCLKINVELMLVMNYAALCDSWNEKNFPESFYLT